MFDCIFFFLLFHVLEQIYDYICISSVYITKQDIQEIVIKLEKTAKSHKNLQIKIVNKTCFLLCVLVFSVMLFLFICRRWTFVKYERKAESRIQTSNKQK